MKRIVITHYRYKRPPRKRKAVALEVPAIVKAAPNKQRMIRGDESDAKAAPERSAIVTAKHPRRRSRFGDVPDMTPEEHKRRGDAADALTGSTGAGSTSLTKGETT
jgi:hypothetical protein